jgi:hypothetical protein
MTTDDGDSAQQVEGAIRKKLITNNAVFDIAWLPDGSGFISSQHEDHAGVIYRYTFADKSLTEIARVTKASIGKVAVSPDGTSIVFERGLDAGLAVVNHGEGVTCPCSIWTVNIDGSEMHQLVADGRAPAWGKAALASSNVTISPIDAFYNWAETEYSQYFPSHQISQDILGYYARHYPTTNIYLGTKGNRVFVYGESFGGLLDAGELQGWLQRSGQ